MEDLLAAAGVSRRTFYQHFGNKEAVIAQMYAQVTDDLAAAVGGAGFSLDDPLGGVRDALDAYLTAVESHQDVLSQLMRAALRSDSQLAPIRARFRNKLADALDLVFTAAFGRRIDRYVFFALISAVEGLCIDVLDGPEPFDRDRVWHAISGIVTAVALQPDRLPCAATGPQHTTGE